MTVSGALTDSAPVGQGCVIRRIGVLDMHGWCCVAHCPKLLWSGLGIDPVNREGSGNGANELLGKEKSVVGQVDMPDGSPALPTTSRSPSTWSSATHDGDARPRHPREARAQAIRADRRVVPCRPVVILM